MVQTYNAYGRHIGLILGLSLGLGACGDPGYAFGPDTGSPATADPPAAMPGSPTAPVPPVSPVTPVSPGMPAPPPSADTYASYAKAVLSSNCIGCHSNYTSLAGVKAESAKIKDRIGGTSGRIMPPGSGLPSADKMRMLAWIAAGLP